MSEALTQLQSWMQAFIVEEEAGPAEGWIRPSATLTAPQRAAIYRDQYMLRMAEALAADYPGVERFLGDEGFLRVVTDYVRERPSRSYTLNRLGDTFPEFLAEQRRLPRRQFLSQLAALERCVTQVFDAEETPPLSRRELRENPPRSWESARLVPVAALRVAAFRYPVSQALEEILEGGSPPLRRLDSWVAVYRRSYAMFRLDLSRPAFLLLERLVAGDPLALALDHALSRSRGINAERLFGWFDRWVTEGLFQRVTAE